MNADQLLAHFEKIADAPDAIPRLRRSVLDLAVRGKLVEQDPADEPASELLKRVSEERKTLLRAKRIKRVSVDPIPLAETPFLVPSNWEWTRLGNVGDWGSGSTPSRANTNFFGGDITWLKSGELNDNRHLHGSEETITQLALDRCSFRMNQPGDLLIAMYGATIGKLAILAESAVTNQAVCGCTPFHGVLSDFLFLFLLSQRDTFRKSSKGGAQPNISKVKIVATPFPLPPLSEQRRIVAKVNELMALCDRLEAACTEREETRNRLSAGSLSRLNAPDSNPAVFRKHATFVLDNLIPLTGRSDQIKAFRQTILNLAVRGKLVEQDPADEPASELLKRIAAEKARLVKNRKIRKPKTFPNMGTEPFSIPNNWRWLYLGEIGITQTGTTPAKSRPENYGTDIPFIKPNDLHSTHVDYSNEGLSLAGAAASRRIASRGSILMVCIGTIGKCQLIDRPCSFNQQINAVSPYAETSSHFIFYALRSSYFQEAAWAASARTTIAILNKGKWERLPFPLPPLAEQHRIVAKVDELMALCDQLEASLCTVNTCRDRLLESLLFEAFEAPAGKMAVG